MSKIVSLSSLSRSKYDKLKKKFSCTNEDLHTHIKQFAYNHQKEGLFQTYFFVDDKENYLAYISVAIATIENTDVQDKIDIPQSIKYSIPSLKVTRLCVFDGNHRRGIGQILMGFVNILAVIQQNKIGCRAIIVDSKDEAIKFYENMGFIEINKEESSNTTFMLIDILKPSELKESNETILGMKSFCEEYNLNELIGILDKL